MKWLFGTERDVVAKLTRARLNILLLLFVCFVPYTARVLAEFYRDRTAILLNFGIFSAIAVVQSILLIYTNRKTDLLNDLLLQRRTTQNEYARYSVWHELVCDVTWRLGLAVLTV